MTAVEGFGSAQVFSAILAGLTTGVAVVDEAGLVLYANPRASHLLKRSSNQLVGNPFPFSLNGRGPHSKDLVLSVVPLAGSGHALRFVSMEPREPTREELLAELKLKTRRLGKLERAIIRRGGRSALKDALSS